MRKLILAAAFAASSTIALAGGGTHHIAIHVDESDPQVMNMALNNVQNINTYYQAKGEDVVIELVAYGPGLQMYLPDSPVADRLATMSLEIETLTFAACGNTHRKMSERAGKEVTLVEEATMVPSGVVRLVELQEQGYSYVRP